MIVSTHLRRWCALAFVVATLVAARAASAQTATTGDLSGVVVDTQGGVLPGVAVAAVHVPTGTRYDTVTGTDGRFQMTNVRIGGPYTITATISGFKEQVVNNVTVALGQNSPIEVKMGIETLTESVNVVAHTAPAEQAGTGSNIPQGVIESLPTISRSITDIARTNPFFNPTTLGSNGAQALSVAGRHNRYNNMQIDGAVNNDLFGLADTGTPGGQTGTQPISFDALEEIQLIVAPYDVRQGGFSGGGLNVVTKSGTNAVHGTAYLFERNQGLIGKIPGIPTAKVPAPGDLAVGTFSDKQGGFSVGGPLVQNKAFYFANVDLGRTLTPSGYSASGDSGQQWSAGADLPAVQQVINTAISKYGFNPGGVDQFSRPTNNNKVFVRSDFNLSSRSQLTLRVNYVDGLQDVGTPSAFNYWLPDHFYSIQDKTWSTVGQLNTTISNNLVNEFRMTYQRERNVRGDQPGQAAFPSIEVDLPDTNEILFGTEPSSQANGLNQDIVEVNDDVTWSKGRHSFSLGTHEELFHFSNLFIQNLYGSYRFSSVANFEAGVAQQFTHSFSNDPSNPLQSAAFGVQQYGLYAGDNWRMAPNFTLTYGLRFDAPHFPDTPHANPLAVTDYGMRTDVVPAPKAWSPRLGFAWDLSHGSNNQQTIRGGLGVFTGRTPYVWLSNQYGNTGVDFTSLSTTFSTTASIPFVADPLHQPTTVGSSGNQTINLIDPNYKTPAVLRGNIAYDHALGFLGLVASTEFVWSKTLEDILYQDLNYKATGVAPDGRLTYTKVDPKVNDAILITNTTQGGTQTIMFELTRPFRNGLSFSGSYLYNHSTSVSDGAAFVALSSWRDQYVSGDANNPSVATSNYQAGHNVTLSATMPIPLGAGFTSMLSFFYKGQSGQPYSLVFNGDANGDGTTFNDVAFLPSDASQVIVTNGTYAQLDAYLSSDSAAKNNRGTVPNRNTGTSPWKNDLDMHYAVDVPTVGHAKVELTMDVLNLLNLMNKNWGWVYFPNFYDAQPIGYGGIDKATGKEILNLSGLTSTSFAGTFSRDDLRSRWSAQWGVRVRF